MYGRFLIGIIGIIALKIKLHSNIVNEVIMALTITTLDSTKEKVWDDLVVSSSFGTLFHTVEWLKLVQKHSNAEYFPLMFYKGTQLVAIYPIFIQKQGPVKVALSPPSRSYMLYLGPVIADYESIKQDKKESTLHSDPAGDGQLYF